VTQQGSIDSIPKVGIPVLPQFDQSIRFALIDGGLLAHSEVLSRVFTGEIFVRLFSSINGVLTTDELIEQFQGDHPVTDLYFALLQLARAGVVREAATIDVQNYERASTSFESVTLNEHRLRTALSELGVSAAALGPLRIVAATHYLDQQLIGINADALASGQPWVVCRTLGRRVWIGPLFSPLRSPCYECFRHRLSINLPIDAWLTSADPDVAAIPGFIDEHAFRIAATILAEELRGFDGGAGTTGLDGLLHTCDVDTLERTLHRVTRRPQCPACGDASMYAERVQREIVLTARAKISLADGGHRAQSADAIIARLSPLVDPLCGVITSLRATSFADSPMHVYTAGLNLARPSHTFARLRHSLRRNSGGKGFSDSQAKASALGESVERYSAVYQGDEPTVRASFSSFNGDAIAPNACMLFSDTQLANREQLNSRANILERIPSTFDENAVLDWTPVWSFTRGAHVHLPTSYLYYGCEPSETRFCAADSNGNAAGGSLEDAILQGFLELVERDATAIWWYNRIPRPAVDLTDVLGEHWPAVRDEYARRDREVWVLDLTTDLGIPAFAAVSRCTSGPSERLLLGLGAHLDPQVGVMRAISELHQMLVTVDSASTDAAIEPDVRGWLTDARLVDHGYLAPSALARRRRADYMSLMHSDLRNDVDWCRKRVEALGFELLTLDQTRADLELPVVKVIVPGLRHFRERFAPGRLYETPVALGWVPLARTERALNPIAFFL
jgi:oxazoline/thiazoline synthase